MNQSPMAPRANRFTLLAYRVPTKLRRQSGGVEKAKKIGAIDLQQSVCVFPAKPEVRRDLGPILQRIADAAAEFHLLPLRKSDSAEEGKLTQQFQDQTSNHYQENIENCEVNFTIVKPNERSGAIALTGAIRGVLAAAGPLITGAAIQASALGFPFIAGGVLKSLYDVGLYVGFRSRFGDHEVSAAS